MDLKLDLSKPYALALEGGGARGAYQIGVWKSLVEEGMNIIAVSGTSAGALNGALIVMGDMKKAESLWENIHMSDVLNFDEKTIKKLVNFDIAGLGLKNTVTSLRDIMRNKGLDITPLYNMLSEQVDEEAIRKSEKELYIVTFSLTDKKLMELRAKNLRKRGEIVDMLLASAYLPVFKNEKLRGKRFADGGVRDVLPVHVLVENGYKDIIAVRLYGFGVERPLRLPKNVNLHTVAPTVELGRVLDFDAKKSQQNVKEGYYDAKRLLFGLAGTQYYVDRHWTEEQAYGFMLEYLNVFLKNANKTFSLRAKNEKLIPKAVKVLGEKGDYYDLLIACLEEAAKEVGIERYRVYTEEELITLLTPYFGKASGRFPQFLPKASSFKTGILRTRLGLR